MKNSMSEHQPTESCFNPKKRRYEIRGKEKNPCRTTKKNNACYEKFHVGTTTNEILFQPKKKKGMKSKEKVHSAKKKIHVGQQKKMMCYPQRAL